MIDLICLLKYITMKNFDHQNASFLIWYFEYIFRVWNSDLSDLIVITSYTKTWQEFAEMPINSHQVLLNAYRLPINGEDLQLESLGFCFTFLLHLIGVTVVVWKTSCQIKTHRNDKKIDDDISNERNLNLKSLFELF